LSHPPGARFLRLSSHLQPSHKAVLERIKANLAEAEQFRRGLIKMGFAARPQSAEGFRAAFCNTAALEQSEPFG
jgi:hypothetical protein